MFWFSVSRIVPKHVKGGTLGVFEHPFFCKIDKKMTGGPFGDICEKKSHKAEKNCTKKFWSRAGLEPMSFCLADLKKAVTSMPSGSSGSLVLVDQLIKFIKSVSSLVLKKSHYYSLRFSSKSAD